MQETTSTSTAELARLSELIDTIYQGATEPSHWDVILPAVVDWVGALRGLLFTPLNTLDNGGFYFNHALPDSMMQLWSTKYQGQDIWSNRAIELGLMDDGSIGIGDEMVPFEELSRTEFYQDFLSKYDMAHMMGGVVFGMDSLQPNLPTLCSFYRGLKEASFTHLERDRLAILIPHLSRSLAVMTRLRNLELKATASLAALDRLSAGVLLFDAHGRLAFANQAARRILEEEDGLKLQHCFNDSSLGEIIIEKQRSQDVLVSAISSAVSPDILHAAHFSSAVTVPRPSGRQDYLLNFSSLAAQNEFGSGADAPRAIAFITDSAQPISLDGELLKKAYGLTPAEVRLAEMLVECMTVDETADRLGVGRSTIKTQLQSIYTKTGTNNRAKLMKLIMSLSQLA
ncbi:MAG: helix-turn-helix transcriptional regulator [Gammaproteobacteria bacterium]|nr:helix-turn-helix transcriptional regulator [Gammaproteobacteria bacterium]MBU1977890.1 helix-turn-helix transcriptional regulator [Gammaproteobacteria bacterium]